MVTEVVADLLPGSVALTTSSYLALSFVVESQRSSPTLI